MSYRLEYTPADTDKPSMFAECNNGVLLDEVIQFLMERGVEVSQLTVTVTNGQ